MTRRCDRCRSEYESGADFGGHDYCMTCYTQVRLAEEQKRAAAERLNQQKTEYLHKQMREDYARQNTERERKAREFTEESRRLMLLETKKKREVSAEGMRKQMKWRIDLEKYRSQASETQQFATYSGIKKKSVPAQILQKNDERATYAARLKRHVENTGKKKPKKQEVSIEQTSMSLSIATGLPVSLSIGQKQVQVFLIGKNASTTPMAVGLEVSILDSQKNTIAAKSEPRTCTIEPLGESKITVVFDLPEDAARGMLTFTALLKENAVYIGRQSAQSNAVSISSQVKSPLDLQYKQDSALFESGALVLTFNNVGESGGILELSSAVMYFSQNGVGKKAALTSRTKVKGGEKNILLRFAPAEEAVISRLDLNLVGIDSNGKPYSLKRKIEKKKAPCPEGKNKTD